MLQAEPLTQLTRFRSLGNDPRAKRSATAALAVAAILFPLVVRNEGYVDALANAFAFAALALGLNIVVGYAGLLDLGYAAFFAIGAYTYGIFASWQVLPPWSELYAPLEWLGLVAKVQRSGVSLVHFQFSFWLMLPICAIVAAFFGALFGAPTLRLRGDYLAIVTLGFGEIVPIVARNMPSLTNGAQGLTGVVSPSLFGYSFGVRSTPYFYLGLAILAALILVSLRLRNSRIGRAWMAIREDEIAAEATGVNRARLKLLAFSTGAAFAGMTGAFYVAKLQTATPEMFMFPVSVMILVMVVLGGIGSVSGVVLGAIILHLLQSWFLPDLSEWLHAFGRSANLSFLQRLELAQATELIFGIILVVMMLFRRQGLIPAARATSALSIDQQTVQPIEGKAALTRASHPVGSPSEPLLEIRGLRKAFGGIRALNGVDLTVERGSIVAVIGPNGSGKTTLFNVVTGLDRADSGSVRLLGRDIKGLLPDAIVRLGMARTFQNLRLFGNMTVLDNVLVGGHVRSRAGLVGAVLRTPRAKAEEAATRAGALAHLALFGNRLMPRLDHLARTLSYANRRRLEIARAVMTGPAILLLDEPAAGMNPSETLELIGQIRTLRGLGLSILLIEHKLEVVNQIADRVVVLDQGEKVAEGSPNEVYRNEDVLRAYLGRTAGARAAA